MIKTALLQACKQLESSSDSPRLDSELLLAHVLGRSRTYVTIYPEKPLTAEQYARFNQLIAQRAQHVPVAYLLQEKEFWSRSFRVSPAVLVPRPDTESLVDYVLTHFSSASPLHVLELGTGSGIIAVTLQLACPNWHITATDRSLAALKQARENAHTLNAHSIDWLASDWFSSIEPAKIKFDLIISNPPYLEENDPHLSRLTAEPRMALVAGSDGLDAIRTLVSTAPAHLHAGGTLMLEHGGTQGLNVRSLFKHSGFSAITTGCDLAGLERFTLGRYGKPHNDNSV